MCVGGGAEVSMLVSSVIEYVVNYRLSNRSYNQSVTNQPTLMKWEPEGLHGNTWNIP